MTRVLVWKELREQRAVWLALAVAAAGCVAALQLILTDNRERANLLAGVLLVATWTYGLVCGALQLSGESEEDTQTFLDTLPATRRRLWTVKAGTGLGLLAAFAAAMMGLALVCGRRDGPIEPSAWLMAGFLFTGLLGYAWGMLFGASAPTVLGAVARAVFGQALAWFVTFLVFVLPAAAVLEWGGHGGGHESRFVLLLLNAVLLVGGAATLSHRIYCRPDRLREQGGGPRGRAVEQPGWGVLFWLVWRQSRGFALGMVGFALLGVVVVTVGGARVWPFLGLILGILCGVTAFADEQQTGAFRFFGDQRFPLGRVWLLKTSLRFAMGAVAAFLLLLGVAAVVGVNLAFMTRGPVDRPDRGLEEHLTSGGLIGLLAPPFLYFALWPVYGFAVGHLCGILFRKPLVASVVSVGVSPMVVALWVPSLVTGGLSAWQVFGVPALLLLGARLLMRPWAADRLLSASAVKIAVGAVLAAGLWFAVGLWVRVAEVPEPPDAGALDAYLATLPKFEDNEGGRKGQLALRRLDEVQRGFVTEEQLRELERQRQRRALPQAAQPQTLQEVPTFSTYVRQCHDVGERGWQAAGDPRLAAFLNRAMAGGWVEQMTEMAEHPPGVIADPRNLALDAPLPETNNARLAAVLLVARGLQQQAAGRPAAFVTNLRIGLALARNLRQSGLPLVVLTSWSVEEVLLEGVERWLEALAGQPDLLRQVLTLLHDFEAAAPADANSCRQAEYRVLLNSVDRPESLLRAHPLGSAAPTGRSFQADLLAFAWQVPWERTRVRRLLLELTAGEPARSLAAKAQLSRLFEMYEVHNILQQVPARQRRILATLRGRQLQVALRLYQAAAGKPADTLDQLVPGILPSVPADPFDGKPFRYRLSKGEELNWPPVNRPEAQGGLPGLAGAAAVEQPPPRPVRDVPAGWGILWSIGEDGQDNGGKRQTGRNSRETQPGEDMIFLVPPPAG